MQKEKLQSILESLIFASDRPVSLKKLAEWMDQSSTSEIQEALDALGQKYKTNEHGIQLEQVAGGFHFRTKVENKAWVKKMMEQKPIRMSRAQLETLAMVAYKQPVTRIEVDEIRGVDSSHMMRTLLDRKLIKIVGVKEVPGRPLLYGTTDDFLEFFNLKDLNDMPSLEQLKELKGDPEAKSDVNLFASDSLPESAEAELSSQEGVSPSNDEE